jgi:hypothetical protein
MQPASSLAVALYSAAPLQRFVGIVPQFTCTLLAQEFRPIELRKERPEVARQRPMSWGTPTDWQGPCPLSHLRFDRASRKGWPFG